MKKTLSTVLGLLFCVCGYAINGDGSAGNPYQIGNVDELYEFASIVNEIGRASCRERVCA